MSEIGIAANIRKYLIALFITSAFAFIAWLYFTSPYTTDTNERWLSLLHNGKVSQIWLIGSRSPEFYNIIDTVKIEDKRVISKASYYITNRKLITRKSVNFKNQLYSCNATLFSCRNSWELYLMKLPDGRGLIESLRGDSIYQDDRAIVYLDSIFQNNVKRKLVKP